MVAAGLKEKLHWVSPKQLNWLIKELHRAMFLAWFPKEELQQFKCISTGCKHRIPPQSFEIFTPKLLHDYGGY